jgi:hypothetical protein
MAIKGGYKGGFGEKARLRMCAQGFASVYEEISRIHDESTSLEDADEVSKTAQLWTTHQTHEYCVRDFIDSIPQNAISASLAVSVHSCHQGLLERQF